MGSPPTSPGGYSEWVIRGGPTLQNFVLAMDNLGPVPPRFQTVHSDLRAAIDAFRQQINAAASLRTQADIDRWQGPAMAAADRADRAIAAYNAPVGTSLPTFR